MRELVDVVDSEDSLTGRTVTLDEAHKEYLPHRIAAVLVFTPDNKLLMQVARERRNVFDHTVGGHVSSNEDYEAAARREMIEEIGLDVSVKKIATGVVSKEKYPDKKLIHVFGVFTAQAPKSWTFSPTEEVERLEERYVEEVVQDMNNRPELYLQGFMTTLSAYLKHENSGLTISAYGKNWGEL